MYLGKNMNWCGMQLAKNPPNGNHFGCSLKLTHELPSYGQYNSMVRDCFYLNKIINVIICNWQSSVSSCSWVYKYYR